MNAIGAMDVPLDLAIVGAGISGIGMAAHFSGKCPDKRFAIVEQRERLGGTWDLFRYPGIRSDSDMYTLGYAFEPWRDEKAIAEGETIRGYLGRIAESRGIAEHIRFGHKVVAADWDSAAALWRLEMEDGQGKRSRLAARFLFLGSGYYDYDSPHDAEIPGLADFAGEVIHPQFWPENFDHAGKRVVVIGSGATAVTLAPAMAESAAEVVMLQRTPTWYLTRPSRDALAQWARRLLPETWAYKLTRARNVFMQNLLISRSRNQPEQMKQYLHKQLAGQLGPDFPRADFTPPYNPWEQRMCLVPDGDLFAALKSGKARIVTGEIERVERDGILLKDGSRLPADAIVTATGLQLAVLGKIALSTDGAPVDIAQRFYYRNCMFSNVPNLAALFGYLNAGWTLRVDIVADWLCRLFRQMDMWGVDVATPTLAADHGLVEDPVFDYFSSGYIQRSKHLIPKSATAAPWRISMNYLSDRQEMRDAPIDDGVLTFARAPAAVRL